MTSLSRRNFLQQTATASAAALLPSALAKAMALTALQPGKLRFGVNYVPRKNWWYCWMDWDQQSICEDLQVIASLGMDHIRIQCLWPYFQPGITNVSERALANLHSLLDAADAAGLDVEVTVLNGWMSGLSFMPAWVAPLLNTDDLKQGNIFTTLNVIEAEKLLFSRIAETVGRHPRFMGFDIGNEMGVLMHQRNNPVSTEQADVWLKDMLHHCDEIALGKLNVFGANDSHWYNDFGFSRKALANTGRATTVHSYIFFDGVLDRYKYNEAPSGHRVHPSWQAA